MPQIFLYLLTLDKLLKVEWLRNEAPPPPKMGEAIYVDVHCGFTHNCEIEEKSEYSYTTGIVK